MSSGAGSDPRPFDIIKMVQVDRAAIALCAIHPCFGVAYFGGRALAAAAAILDSSGGTQ